jgi:hypothetical protein
MVASTLTLTAVIMAPPLDVAPPSFARVEMHSTPESFHVIAYDAHGDETAEIVLWDDGQGVLHLDSNFADGLYCTSEIADGAEVTHCSDPDAAAARIAEISALLDRGPAPHAISKGWLCAGELFLTAAACVTGHAIPCVVGSVAMACACIEAVTTGECFE